MIRILIYIMFFCSVNAFSQVQVVPADSANAPVITFLSTSHDFGSLKKGDKAEFAFEFRNTGKNELVINAVSASCGCTVAEYPKKPVRKNKKAAIKVKYNTSSTGSFQKTVTVNSNASNSPVKLTIKGSVE